MDSDGDKKVYVKNETEEVNNEIKNADPNKEMGNKDELNDDKSN